MGPDFIMEIVMTAGLGVSFRLSLRWYFIIITC